MSLSSVISTIRVQSLRVQASSRIINEIRKNHHKYFPSSINNSNNSGLSRLHFIRPAALCQRVVLFRNFLQLNHNKTNNYLSAIYHHYIKPLVLRKSNGLLLTVAFSFMDKGEPSNVKGVSWDTLKKSDVLFDEGHYDQVIELLKSQSGWYDNEEILWRVARCEYTQSKAVKDQKDKYEELLNNAHLHVQHSLELDEKNGLAHKWAAILLDAVSTLKGQKERVLQVLNVRTHMEKAIEYAPTDATSYYLLGEWHFSCYHVTWWERKIASIAFAALPDADIEVALKMFEKAEEIDKDFYSKNKVMIAKTLFILKRDKERALVLLKEVVDKFSSSDKWDDKEVSNVT